MKVKYKLSGFKELERKFRDMDAKAIKGRLMPSVKKAHKPVAELARARAPVSQVDDSFVGPVRHGRDSIVQWARTDKKAGGVAAFTGYQKWAFYLGFFEFGARGGVIPRLRWLGRSMEDTAQRQLESLKTSLSDSIDRWAKKNRVKAK